MGAFFTNVQVQGQGLTRARVVEALRSWVVENGFVEAKPDQTADRTLLVGPDGPWIAIYDEDTEGQDETRLDAMANQLSSMLGRAAVTVLVHDSDVLRLGLFHRGRLVHRYDSNPAFSGKKRTKKIAASDWAEHLIGDRTVAELEAVLAEEKSFAEDTLRRVAELVGMDARQASIGFRYADKADASYATLRLVASERPAYETPTEGPPRFDMGGHSPSLDVSVGSPFRGSFAVRNVGGATKGVDVVAWGNALTSGAIALREVELVVGEAGSGVRLSAPLTASKSEGGEALWVASFPDVEIAAGVPMGGLAGLDPRKMVALMYRSNVHANCVGDVLEAGERDLQIGFIAREDRHCQHGYTCLVRAFPKSRRPLRATPGVEAHELRPLDARTTLFAIASCTADLDVAAELAAAAIEKWGRLFSDDGRYSIGVYRATPGARPKSGSAKAKAFFRSARWKSMRGELATEAVVTAERQVPSPEGWSMGAGDGFAFGRTIVPVNSPDDPDLATLGLWMNVEGKPEDEVDAARTTLVAIVDELMSRAGGVQALMGRWGWHPAHFDATPYERACGVHGQCTLRRSWLTQFVRGVTDDWLWLDRDLLARIDRSALEAVAVLEPVAIGVRARLRAGASLDALEAALAPLLPDHAAWIAGQNRYYGR